MGPNVSLASEPSRSELYSRYNLNSSKSRQPAGRHATQSTTTQLDHADGKYRRGQPRGRATIGGPGSEAIRAGRAVGHEPADPARAPLRG